MDYIEIYIKNKLKEYKSNNYSIDNTKNYDYFYQGIEPIQLAEIFGYFHSKLNYLFNFLIDKKNRGGHYNAEESRQLFDLIGDIKGF